MKRYFFPDEQPEFDLPWIDYDYYKDLCGFCGHNDHIMAKCPNRPSNRKKQS